MGMFGEYKGGENKNKGELQCWLQEEEKLHLSKHRLTHNYTRLSGLSSSSVLHIKFCFTTWQKLTMTPTRPGAKRTYIMSLTFVLRQIKSGNSSAMNVRHFKCADMNF